MLNHMKVGWRGKESSLLHGWRAMAALAINRLKSFFLGIPFTLFGVAFLPVEVEVSVWSVI
jgi:hypothetical protein